MEFKKEKNIKFEEVDNGVKVSTREGFMVFPKEMFEKSAGEKEMSEGKQDLWIHRNPAWGIKQKLRRRK